MQWAVGSGLIEGSADHGSITLNPGDSATRAQTAQILMRFTKNF